MMHVQYIVMVLAFIVLPAFSHGQEALSLSEALTLARVQNPELLAARQELEIARSRLTKAQYISPFNPTLGGEVAHRSSSDARDSVDFAVSLSQEIEIAGQRGKRIEEAERTITVVSQRVRDRERLVLAEVKDNFYRALSLRRRFDLSRQVVDLNRRLFTIAMNRFQAGELPKMEVNLTEIRLGQARKEALTAERDYHNTLRALERLLGQDPRGTLVLTGELAVTPQTFALPTLLAVAVENRPDLQAARVEGKRLDAELALTRRLMVPNPTLGFVYREEERRDRIVGAEVSFPLPVFDRKQAEMMQLTSRKDQAGHEQQKLELQVRQEVGDALRAYEAATAEVAVFEQAVLERATENFQLIEVAYQEGKMNLLQLVVVQNDLINAQLSYVDSLVAYWQARVALERATGKEL